MACLHLLERSHEHSMRPICEEEMSTVQCGGIVLEFVVFTVDRETGYGLSSLDFRGVPRVQGRCAPDSYIVMRHW